MDLYLLNMTEHNIKFIERTFGELERNEKPSFKDPYQIMSSLGPKMREAVLHNPSGYRKEEVCQILAVDGDVVVGATNPFSGRLLMNGEIVPCQNGSTLFSLENYRKENVGGDLFMQISNLHPMKNNFYSGISQMALPLYRALKYTVFGFPRLIYLRKSQSVVHALLHSEGWWTKPIIWLADTSLILHRSLLRLSTNLRLSGYKIEEVTAVPNEVEAIVMSDKHPYMELHDKAWFEWSLNYSISEDERTKRRLYVMRKNERIEGFFLIKQEFFKQASGRGFKNVYLGSVMEWGIAKDSQLREKDIAILSLSCFDKNIDGVQFASNELKTVKQLKRYLFVQVGKSNLGFRIKSIKDEAMKDINNWRIRLAASDTLLN